MEAHTILSQNAAPGSQGFFLQFKMADIVFGSPANSNCSGTGICRMLPKNRRKEVSCPVVPAHIGILANGKMRVVIHMSKIPMEVMGKQFLGQRFIVESAFQIPKWLKVQFDKQIRMDIITPGCYALEKNSDYLWFDF